MACMLFACGSPQGCGEHSSNGKMMDCNAAFAAGPVGTPSAMHAEQANRIQMWRQQKREEGLQQAFKWDAEPHTGERLSIDPQSGPRHVLPDAWLRWNLSFSLRWTIVKRPSQSEQDRSAPAEFAARCNRWSLRVHIPSPVYDYIPAGSHPKQQDHVVYADLCESCVHRDQETCLSRPLQVQRGGLLVDEADLAAEEEACLFECVVAMRGSDYNLVIGPHQKVELALVLGHHSDMSHDEFSGSDGVLDQAAFSIWFRTIQAPPALAPVPSCWLPEEPVHKQVMAKR